MSEGTGPGKGHNSGRLSPTAAGELLAIIESVERLTVEKDHIADQIKSVFAQAKAVGFETKIIRGIIRDRRISAEDRAERDALNDIYRAAIGMLDGTPLGQAAIKRLTKPADEKKPDEEQGPDARTGSQSSQPAPTEADARALGEADAKAGKPVTSNPFPPHDPRRAAYDEAWCKAIGSDGMDIPKAFQRNVKPKPPEGGETGGTGEGDGSDRADENESPEPGDGE